MELSKEDLSRITSFLYFIEDAAEKTGLDLGDAIIYDDGEPLGTIGVGDGKYVFKVYSGV